MYCLIDFLIRFVKERPSLMWYVSFLLKFTLVQVLKVNKHVLFERKHGYTQE